MSPLGVHVCVLRVCVGADGAAVAARVVVLGGFAVAAVTDFLDGLLARRWGQITAVGSFLDPLADKVLINGMAVPLAMQGLVPPSLVALMLGRDVAIIAGVMCDPSPNPPLTC